MKWCRALLLGLIGAAVMSTHAAAGVEPPPAPPPDREFVSDPSALVQVPVGCPFPAPADLAFVGTVVAKDEYVDKGTVRFRIDQVRAGDATPFAVDGLIDVRYGPDSQYLDGDAQYLVSAAIDSTIGALASKVSPATPLFGGDAVVGVEDTEVACPVVDDPIQTINLDGTPVDSGLLTPLLADKKLLLATIGVPAAIVAAAVLGLVLLRRGFDLGMRGIFALGRSAVVPGGDHRAAQVRRHATPDEAAAFADAETDEADSPGDEDGVEGRSDGGVEVDVEHGVEVDGGSDDSSLIDA